MSALFAAAILCSAVAAAPPASPASEPLVVLVVDDATRLPAGELARLRRGASDAISEAGVRVKDLSELAGLLFRPGTVAPTFERNSPASWPRALVPAWEEAHAACRARLPQSDAGAVARMQSARIAVQCQRELSEALYARLLRHERPARVIELSLSETVGGAAPPTTITVRSFTLDGAPSRLLRREVPRHQVVNAAVAALVELNAGKGEQAPPVQLRDALPAR